MAKTIVAARAEQKIVGACDVRYDRVMRRPTGWWLASVASFFVLILPRPAQSRQAADALREAQALEAAGNPAAALSAYRSALEAAPPNSADRARALQRLAALETGQGKYADARGHASESARLFEQLGDAKQASMSLNWDGLAALYAGQYDDATQRFAAALERATSAGFTEGRVEEIGNLANVQFYRGRYADAERLYAEALATTAASSSEPWTRRRRRLLLANQATLYQRLGRDQDALAIYRELGASTELRPRERAQMLVNLGVLYRRLGDPIKALSTYDQARMLFAGDRDVDGELNTLKNRGIVLALDLDRLEEAERTFSATLDTATRVGNRREMLHGRLYRGETALRAGGRDRAEADFTAALALARELRTPEEEWKALYGLGRVASDSRQASAYFGEAIDTIEGVRETIRIPSSRAEFLNDKREVYDALIAANLPDADPTLVFELIERSHSRMWRERLHLEERVGLSRVQEALGDDTLLLDYWNGPQGAAVVAVSRHRVGVFPIHVDEGHIERFVDALSSGASETWRESSRALGSQVLPSADWFTGVEHVVVVPDGALALVPFDVLGLAGQLVVERAALTYAPTAAILVGTRRPPGWLPPWRLQLRAFADPVETSRHQDGESVVGRRLTASSREARDVAAELGGRALFHLGADNRKAYLLAPQRAPLLHLATHAVADTSAMEQSRIAFSAADGSASSVDYLFLKEAYGLQLEGVDLVVLSACDTERGRLVRGEGVQSFSRAFLAAGAQSTVTTMWRVADGPTADVMRLFYHFLARGEPRDEALRHAKLRFLNGGSPVANPHYWASFVLTGDGLHAVPRAITWTLVGVCGAGVALVAAFGARRRFQKALARRSQQPQRIT